jgi:hypothetical protein
MREKAMSSLYAMQRANGDWFALDDHGRFRVPVFSSSRDGMMARGRHWGMQLFKPVALDGRAFKQFTTPADGTRDVYFWMVDNPFTNLSRGRPMEHAQLALLVDGGAQPLRG